MLFHLPLFCLLRVKLWHVAAAAMEIKHTPLKSRLNPKFSSTSSARPGNVAAAKTYDCYQRCFFSQVITWENSGRSCRFHPQTFFFQPQDPDGAVVAEAPSRDENPGQVRDRLRHVRLGPAGTRVPGPAQRERLHGFHLIRLQQAALPQETSCTSVTAAHTMIDRVIADWLYVMRVLIIRDKKIRIYYKGTVLF